MSTAAHPSAAALETAWRREPGLRAWLADTGHRATGARLVVGGLALFVLAGIAALVLRGQLAQPDGTVVDPELYDQLFSIHGATMLFLFAVPIMQGFALYFVPLQIGTREAALPRLAAFGFWLLVAAALGMWGALAIGEAPDSGWFNYVPLATPRYQPGYHADVYAGAVLLSQVAVICLAISVLATIAVKRAPGMSVHRMPLLAWAVGVAMTMIIVAMPPVVVAATLLVMDSRLGTHFFGAAAGGDPILWQHLFWFYGHPLVYIMLLPGLGIVSTVTASFAKRPMVGYPLIVTSYLAIGLISFCVWVHHMFASGRATAGLAVFSAATMAVAVPSGIHVFAVLATLWHGRVKFAPPLLFVLGFILVFVFGGISGITLGAISTDWQVHDTYFVVAHFHFVLLGGVVMPMFAGLAYWYPKLTGWMLGARLAVAAFALILVGIALSFFPMHVAGVLGMPRRVWTYPADMGWTGMNLASTIGAAMLALGVLLFLVDMAVSVGRRRAGPDPWGSGTLEWSLPSPPPPYAFERIPTVTTRYPLWEQELEPADEPHAAADPGPAPSVWPLVTAACLAAGVIGTVFDPLWMGVGLLLAFIAAVEWARSGPGEPQALWAGTALGLASLFVALSAVIGAWWFLAATNHEWPIPPVRPRPWGWAVGLTLLLAGAVALVLLARRRARAARDVAAPLAGAAVLAVLYAAVCAAESIAMPYNQAANASASAEFAIAWSFALCVLVLGGMAGVAAWDAARGALAPRRHGLLSLAAYAGLLAAGWPLVAFTLYVGPRIV